MTDYQLNDQQVGTVDEDANNPFTDAPEKQTGPAPADLVGED